MDQPGRSAIIVGASSGIGEALARQLAAKGWRLGLAARRLDKLQDLASQLPTPSLTCSVDLNNVEECRQAFARMAGQLGRVDLVVIGSATGDVNHHLDWTQEHHTLTVNVVGFAAIAQAAFELFVDQGGGHLLGISSIAKFRASGEAASYCASKAFVAMYLDGLRDLAHRRQLNIVVTEACPGFVDTALMKADKPFWVASPDEAAQCIYRAIARQAKRVYVTRRWGLIAWLLRLLP